MWIAGEEGTVAGERLGIYVDSIYYVDPADPRSVWADPVDLAFLTFAAEVGRRFCSTVLFGRTVRRPPPRGCDVLPGMDLAPLPHYRDLRDLRGVLRATAGTVEGFLRGLSRVDVVWVFGPHPLGLILIGLALVQGKRVALGVRQDTVRYYRSRLPSARWKRAVAAAWLLDRLHRLASRRLPTTVVGREIARSYGEGRATVLPMTVSLVRARDLGEPRPANDWSGTIELLTVGRLEPEKNPLLLVDALAELERARPGRFRLTWLGHGRLEQAVRARAQQAGVGPRLDLRGFVPHAELLEHYRRAHTFVHVSLTEGLPQVLVEALAAGTPIVATDVGSVRDALQRGQAGLLVPPDDTDALVRAILQMSDDEELRRRLVRCGRELARQATLESESARVAAFLASRPPNARDMNRQPEDCAREPMA